MSFNAITEKNIHKISERYEIPDETIQEIKVVAKVLPFRVNGYVLNELIDWKNLSDDPIFRYTFPQKEMLLAQDFEEISNLLKQGARDTEIEAAAITIRQKMNPHPSGQMQFNRPFFEGEALSGIQHKYRQTVLFFPGEGQTCHSYCNFCFRWQQFVPPQHLHFASTNHQQLINYLESQQKVTDIIFTGGDPMVMNTRNFERYLMPLLKPELSHIQNIRIGTKSLTYWPYRYTGSKDADNLLKLFELLIRNGKHVTLMAHYNHLNELMPEIAQQAIRRLHEVGVVIRSQAPVLAKVNDTAESWEKMLNMQIKLGIIPYYMFVERDTGPYDYYKVSLAKVLSIYQAINRNSSGLMKTLRGPVMSALNGKVEILDIAEINYNKVFVLRYLQARDQSWVNKIFYAKYSENAAWFSDLEPQDQKDQYLFQS